MYEIAQVSINKWIVHKATHSSGLSIFSTLAEFPLFSHLYDVNHSQEYVFVECIMGLRCEDGEFVRFPCLCVCVCMLLWWCCLCRVVLFCSEPPDPQIAADTQRKKATTGDLDEDGLDDALDDMKTLERRELLST